MTEQEQELREAFDRVVKSLEGIDLKATKVEIETMPGQIDVGMRIPQVKNRAGDVRLIAAAIPKDKQTQKCQELAFGVRTLADDLVVQQQSPCLAHLVAKARPFIPVDEPAPASPEEPPNEPS